MNPKPLSEICTKIGIPKELLELLIAFITNNEANIQNCIANLIDKIMPNEISELMLSLHNLIFGNITKDLKPIAKIFSVEYTLLIEVVIAIYRNDNNLTRYTIFSVIDRLAEKSKCEQLVEGVNIFKNRVMALSTLSMGSDLDIVSMVKISLPYFPSQKIQRLYEASKGDIGSIKHIIGNLCNCQVKVVMEICNLFLEDNFKANKIARHLGLEPEQAHVLTAYICLVIDCQKYSAKISSRPKNSADFSETFIIKEKEKFSARLESNLMILSKAKAIKADDSVESIKQTIIPNRLKSITLKLKNSNNVQDDIESEVAKIKKSILNALDAKKKNTTVMLDEIEQISTQVQSALDIHKDKVVYLEAICNVAASFICNIDPSEHLKNNENYKDSISKLSHFLEMKDEHLYFLLDLLSGNPYRIFK